MTRRRRCTQPLAVLRRVTGRIMVCTIAGRIYCLRRNALRGLCALPHQSKTVIKMKQPFFCLRKMCFLTIALISLVASCGGAPSTRPDAATAKSRLATAEAMFQERCKTAGEKIYCKAENVEGVLLMKIRLGITNYGDQFRLDDPYRHDSTEDEYIKSFLYGRNSNGYLAQPDRATRLGYRYVEATDPANGKRYRFAGSVREVEERLSGLSGGGTIRITKFALDKTPTGGPPPRYGVTYDDISTREEREYWIAGSSLKVIDLYTNEVVAERIGYMMDRAQGNTSGGSSPWLLAASHACPKFPTNGGSTDQIGQTRNFVEKVLHVMQER